MAISLANDSVVAPFLIRPALTHSDSTLSLASSWAIVATIAVGVVLLLFSAALKLKTMSSHGIYDHIPPAIDYGIGGILRGSLHLIMSARSILDAGYRQHGGRTFKIPAFGMWRVVVNTSELADEICKASEDDMSLHLALDATFAMSYTMVPSYCSLDAITAIVTKAIRQSLSKSVEHQVYADLSDEISTAFKDTLHGVGHDGNDDQLVKLSIRLTLDIMATGMLLPLFPRACRRFVADACLYVLGTKRRFASHLHSVISERLRLHSPIADKASRDRVDLLDHFIEQTPPDKRTVDFIVHMIMISNVAAIHTSAITLTQALLHLATSQEYQRELRLEASPILESLGWTPEAFSQMPKLDSFLKESSRMNGIGLASPFRMVLRDYTLSDGTRVSPETIVCSNIRAIHRDERVYAHAEEFDGFRFADQLNVSSSSFDRPTRHYYAFGYGRHTCPGRFLASAELKMMMTYLVLNFDMVVEDPVASLAPSDFVFSISASRSARILLKRRGATQSAI
ncbi:hypothetical protein EIP91_011316 [Steccherinum ochraceum]|uniref:Cytochrome P450 n=1 Tax=Steccherinum ochraceum TaxID=92696 RepID=A0A4V2MX03_9APHY|nr:hypothetical protein EIP91_011316 [Steccherinum ochraceum]